MLCALARPNQSLTCGEAPFSSVREEIVPQDCVDTFLPTYCITIRRQVTLRGTKSDIFMVAADAPVPAAHSRQTASRRRVLDANALYFLSRLEAGDTSAARRRDRCRRL